MPRACVGLKNIDADKRDTGNINRSSTNFCTHLRDYAKREIIRLYEHFAQAESPTFYDEISEKRLLKTLDFHF